MSANPPAPTQRIFATRRRALLWAAGATTTAAVLWPLGDLYAHGTFTTPRVWWMVLLVSLASWLAYIVTDGQNRIREALEEKIDDVRNEITEYGDQREAHGQAVALRLVGQNGSRRPTLTPVE